MGRRGPAPKPTMLRVLEGRVQHRALPVGEPIPRHVMPRRPAMLTGEARAEWDRQAPRLFAMRVLTEIDGGVLTLWCQNWKRWCEAEAAVQRNLEASGRLNRMRVLTANRYATALLQTAGQLGMTPSARARIQLKESDLDLSDDILS